MAEKNLTDTILEEKRLLNISGAKVFVRGKQLDNEQKRALRESAKNFSNSELWKYFRQEVRDEAVKTLLNSKNDRQMIEGQTMVRNLEVMERLIITLASL